MRKIIIEAQKNQFEFVFRELFAYKDLFWLLAYKDLRVRYAQTFLGLTWAFIQPLQCVAVEPHQAAPHLGPVHEQGVRTRSCNLVRFRFQAGILAGRNGR